MNTAKLLLCAALYPCWFSLQAQDTLRYSGAEKVNVDYHDGRLPMALGVHNLQVMRADRSHPDKENGRNWTYNHAPMLAYWNNTFYLEYLSNLVGEHVPPGQTLLLTSADGKKWSEPVVVFPPYKVPDGTKKPDLDNVAKDLYSVMHQRMGFYTSKKGRLFALAYYGISFFPKDGPNDGDGIGRVIREILPEGKFGPIHFIRYNHGFSAKNSQYPFYKTSKDKGFVEACNEILNNDLVVQQWAEESDKDDPLIKLKGEYKAFSYYYLPDARVVGLWKNGLTSISKDQGKTWEYAPLRAPKLVNSNAKIWGQRTSDGKYALVYNPSEFRWPLAISVSTDGLDYTNLLLVHGDITSMRYGGEYKSYGPQYIRGISENNGTPADNKLWLTYSVNKEDIWVSSVPLPVTETPAKHANDVFGEMAEGRELDLWNIYSPMRAPVKIEKMQNGTRALALMDADPFDYAKATRLIPETKRLRASFSVIAQQNNRGLLDVEFQDKKGTPGIRISFDELGSLRLKAGYRNKNLLSYQPGMRYDIVVDLDADARMYTVTVNGEKMSENTFFAPLDNVARIAFRTGDTTRFPTADTPTDQKYDLPDAEAKIDPATFFIPSFKTEAL